MNLPIDMALALLSDERLDNTHPKPKQSQKQTNSSNSTKNSATTYVAKRRRHSQK